MPQERRLTAIMFTDIVGYTSVMGKDEDKAFQLLKKNRNIQKPTIKKHGGAWLKEMGDGTLASFPSVLEAVYCAKKIQELCSKEADLNLRIGIHLGEVIFEEGDVFGDGVNIASRIEPLAAQGGIIITEAVFQNVQNKKGIETGFIGVQKLKNVNLPVRLYEVKIPGVKSPHLPQKTNEKKPHNWVYFLAAAITLLIASNFLWELYQGKKSKVPIEYSGVTQNNISIAVLPFINRSNDPEQEYFSDGITEEIITQLAKIGELSVTSSRSVFTYKDNLKDIPTIGKELGVSYILEGNVRKQGERLRISTQLIDTKTDRHLWVNDFDREIIEILDVQTEVAKKVAEALDIELTKPEESRIERKSTDIFSAYDYYLKAIHEDKKWTLEGATKALEYLEKALEIDPQFSEAYSLYAWQYVNLATITSSLDPRVALDKALPAIKKAVEFDSLSSDAYLVYGSVNFYLEWNFEEAQKNFERSMELNSWGESPIYQCICAYVEFLMAKGEFTEILKLFENIHRIDPNFFQMYDYESYIYLLDNDIDSAISSIQKRTKYSDSLDWHLNMTYGSILYLAGIYEEAAEKLERSLFLEKSRNKIILLYLSLSYIQLEKMDDAMKILQELIAKDDNGKFGLKTIIATIYNEIGDEEKTFEYLDKAYEAHESILLWLKITHYKNLDDHPRYLDLLRKIGFET